MLASSQRLLNSDFISFVSSLSNRVPPKERAEESGSATGFGGYSLFLRETSGQFRNLSFQERAVKLKEAYWALSDDERADLTARAAAREASSHNETKIERVDLPTDGPVSYNAFVKTNYRFSAGASHTEKMRLLAIEWRNATRRLKRIERARRKRDATLHATFTLVDE